jgi:hypothetical protein
MRFALQHLQRSLLHDYDWPRTVGCKLMLGWVRCMLPVTAQTSSIRIAPSKPCSSWYVQCSDRERPFEAVVRQCQQGA